MCNRCCKQSLCLVASHPPPHPAILPLLDDRGRYQLSIILQVHVANSNKSWLRNFVHKNNWKLCETFFNRKKKVSIQVKQKWNIIFPTLYVVLPPPPFFFPSTHIHTHLLQLRSCSLKKGPRFTYAPSLSLSSSVFRSPPPPPSLSLSHFTNLNNPIIKLTNIRTHFIPFKN